MTATGNMRCTIPVYTGEFLKVLDKRPGKPEDKGISGCWTAFAESGSYAAHLGMNSRTGLRSQRLDAAYKIRSYRFSSAVWPGA